MSDVLDADAIDQLRRLADEIESNERRAVKVSRGPYRNEVTGEIIGSRLEVTTEEINDE